VFSAEPDLVCGPLPILPEWPATDLITNTVVQVMVTAEGNTASETVLTPSGIKDADDFALGVARTLAYKPLPEQPSAPQEMKIRWARLQFDWQVVPLPAGTNAIAGP
jgi:TonB family protein